MTYYYACYGLQFASDLEMPELASIPSNDITADIEIRLAPLEPTGPEGALRINSNLWIGKQVLRLHVSGVAHYEVRNGCEIRIDPLPDANPLSLRLFLQGSALGALLMQRGHLVLHGNAIRIGDACMICVGHSGAGKSTLAAAFLRRGYEILADDVVPIRADGHAIPGFPRIKLWQDAADQLDIRTAGLSPILPGMDKYNLPLQRDEQALTPLPVRWIYLMDWHDADTLRIEPVKGTDGFRLLNSNTYRRHYLQDQEDLTRHLKQCADLTHQARLMHLRRPADKSLTPDDTINWLLTDMLSIDSRPNNIEGLMS